MFLLRVCFTFALYIFLWLVLRPAACPLTSVPLTSMGVYRYMNFNQIMQIAIYFSHLLWQMQTSCARTLCRPICTPDQHHHAQNLTVLHDESYSGRNWDLGLWYFYLPDGMTDNRATFPTRGFTMHHSGSDSNPKLDIMVGIGCKCYFRI